MTLRELLLVNTVAVTDENQTIKLQIKQLSRNIYDVSKPLDAIDAVYDGVITDSEFKKFIEKYLYCTVLEIKREKGLLVITIACFDKYDEEYKKECKKTIWSFFWIILFFSVLFIIFIIEMIVMLISY